MKNKIAIASAFLAASSFSMGEIVINDFLSFEGFVDSSYSHSEIDGGPADDSNNTFEVDQVEISWLFNFGAVTGQIDLQHEGTNIQSEGDVVEQAFVNYALSGGGVVTAGRYASMLGFEAYEPTGLYQYSRAYGLVEGGGSNLPWYSQGVKYTIASDSTFFGISLQDQTFGADSGRLGGDDDSSYGVEVAASIDLGAGFSLFVGGAFEEESNEEYMRQYNAYVTYETGAWLFAAELNVSEAYRRPIFSNGVDITMVSGLVMANYAYSDSASVTARISALEIEADEFEGFGITKYTLAHNYALSDSLLLVTEVNYTEGDVAIGNDSPEDGDSAQFAIRLLFSF